MDAKVSAQALKVHSERTIQNENLEMDVNYPNLLGPWIN